MRKIFLIITLPLFAMAANAQVTFGIKAGGNYSKHELSVKGLSTSINPGNKFGFYAGGFATIRISELFSFQPELIYSYDGSRIGVSKSLLNDVLDYANDLYDGELDEVLGLFKDNKYSMSINSHNIRIPLMARFNTGCCISLLAGPYVSYRAGMSTHFSSDLTDLYKMAGSALNVELPPDKDARKALSSVLHDNFYKFDVGFALGIEVQVCRNMFIEARYTHSLKNSLKKEISLNNDKLADFVEDMGFPREYITSIPDINISDPVRPTVKYSSIQIGLGYRF